MSRAGYWASLLRPGSQRSTETLRQNAMRFVQVVERIAKEQRYVQMFPHLGYRGVKGEQYGWIAMPNHQWRELVIEQLQRNRMVDDPCFVPPDHLDGWTFSARSIVPTPRVALLGLEERI